MATSPKPDAQESQKRIRVKALGYLPLPHHQHFPNNTPSWGLCDFVFDPEEEDYDWLVVVHDLLIDDSHRPLPVLPLHCSPEKTLLITSEPSAIKCYGRAFTRQFGTVLTPHEPWALLHPCVIRHSAAMMWRYRRSWDEHANALPHKKDKDFSAVVSSKASANLSMHRARFKFAAMLEDKLGDRIERFGTGVRYVADKADALLPYRHHLVIENQISPDYFSEKLSDAWLAFCVPIYCGCTNLEDYFPPGSWISIDLDKPQAALETIESVLENAEEEYQQRLPKILEARRILLHDFSPFGQIAYVVQKLEESGVGYSTRCSKIKSRDSLRRWPNRLSYKLEKYHHRKELKRRNNLRKKQASSSS